MTVRAGSAITTYFRVCDGARIRFADSNVVWHSACEAGKKRKQS